MNEIIDTDEMAEEAWDGDPESEGAPEDMSATKEPESGPGIEFHVQMRARTMEALDDLIVEAAARQILGVFGKTTIAKEIEDKCLVLLNEKATKALDAVTTEIIDQPMTPSFGDKKPVTMREFLALYGREYLTARVDRDGKPATSGYGSYGARMEWLVARALDHRFKAEIEKATNAAIGEIQTAIRAQHAALIAVETARIREAIAKATKS